MMTSSKKVNDIQTIWLEAIATAIVLSEQL